MDATGESHLHHCPQGPSLVNGSSYTQPADLSILASIITVVKTSLSLAQYIGQLIQDVRQQDANAEELEFRLESLTRALGEATSAYGPQGNNSSSSSNEDQLRQDVRRIVIDYKGDLERVGTELKKQIRLGNWLKLAWRKQHAALTLAKIEKSISERQKQLGFLVQLLHGYAIQLRLEIAWSQGRRANT